MKVFELDNEIEKYVQLTMQQRMRILSDQIMWLVRNHSGHQPLLLSYLPDAFRIHYGFALRPEQYDARSLDELITKLRNHVQVEFWFSFVHRWYSSRLYLLAFTIFIIIQVLHSEFKTDVKIMMNFQFCIKLVH